jgi:uncharacterized protein (TIGR02231 family)
MNTSQLLALCLLPVASLAGSQCVDVSSSLDSVTIYQGVARVTRTFEVSLPGGQESRLRFVGLPSGVDPQTVQVSAAEGAAINLGIATFDNVFRPEDRSAALLALEAKVREIQARQNALGRERNGAQAFARSRMDLFNSISKGLAETGEASLYALASEAWASAEAAAQESQAKVDAIDEQLRVLVEELSAAQVELGKQQDREMATCMEYMVEAVSSGGATKGTLTYYVRGPSWSPSYIVKADTKGESIYVSYLAAISQRTGEDWSGVNLFLETSSPASGASPVKPRPVFLEQLSFQRSRGFSADKSALDFESISEVGGVAPAPAAVNAFEVRQTVVNASLTGFRAQVPGRVNVASSDTETVLPLMDREMKCEFHSETIPVTAQTAFLVCEVEECAFPMPVLEGRMQVIVDGSTNGSGYMSRFMPGEKMTIGLGVNQNVVVERRIVAEQGRDAGLFGSNRVEERHYVNTITNHMAVSQRIVVMELVPISRDEKIIVKVVKPKDAAPDGETGLIEQEVILKPGQSIELPTLFRVSYPADWSLNDNF